MSEMDVRGDDLPFDEAEPPTEAPEADAAEKARRLHDAEATLRHEVPLDVNPADAAEQDREVGLDDDDDYR
ncbi:hypothetical protein ACIBHX_21145 [Nonomuraea sp. NPDC050536]|uniref:hypothetical protein n=1 Tax=Nonomuraea sp. NPDC050536 TaxID=3364366 RepID=UPI0037CC087B